MLSHDKSRTEDGGYVITYTNTATGVNTTKFSDGWPGLDPLEKGAKQLGADRVQVVKVTNEITEYIVRP